MNGVIELCWKCIEKHEVDIKNYRKIIREEQMKCKHLNKETKRVGSADYRENETKCLDCGIYL